MAQTDRFTPAAVLGHLGPVVRAFVPAGCYPWTLQNSFKIKASPLGDLHAHCEPLDTEAVLRAARETPASSPRRLPRLRGFGRRRGWDDRAAPSDKVKILSVPELASTGSAGYLLHRYGICPEGIAETAPTLIK